MMALATVVNLIFYNEEIVKIFQVNEFRNIRKFFNWKQQYIFHHKIRLKVLTDAYLYIILTKTIMCARKCMALTSSVSTAHVNYTLKYYRLNAVAAMNEYFMYRASFTNYAKEQRYISL
jgi:hypothetical protein